MFRLSSCCGTGLNGQMPNRDPRPSLASLFLAFASISVLSIGGALAAWIRREVVQRRLWLDDRQFLSGYALSKMIPGASNVNLTVFIGTLLRGLPGAVVALLGLTLVPIGIMLAIGVLYLRAHSLPGGALVSVALTGMGAVAVGLNLGLGIRLARLNIRKAVPAAVAAMIALGIGVLGFPLLRVLLVMIPVSLGLAWWQGPEPRA